MPTGRKATIRRIFLLHRWLGMGLAPLMVMWCLSGIVMLWHPWPTPDAKRVLRAHPDLHLPATTILPPALNVARRARIAMAGDDAVVTVLPDNAPGSSDAKGFSLRSGRAVTHRAEALVPDARAYLPGGERDAPLHAAGLRRTDQWIMNTKGRARGFYRYDFADPERTSLYIAPGSGDVVQSTTRRERFWAWIGPVPHWLYFSLLRRHDQLWADTLILLSAPSIFLTVTGLWIGLRRFGSRRGRRTGAGNRDGGRRRRFPASPYRGAAMLHHLAGLSFGLFALSWITTGFLSMNPAGFLEKTPPPDWTQQISGPLDARAVAAALPALQKEPGIVAVELDHIGPGLFLTRLDRDGTRRRTDDRARPAPLSADALRQQLAQSGIEARVDRLARDDAYYFSNRHRTRPFPVFRIAGPDGTRLYLDPVSGAPLLVVGQAARETRWIVYGPHDLDFLSFLRAPSSRILLLLPLLCGVALLCLCGLWIGICRIGYMLDRHRRSARRRRSSRPVRQKERESRP